MNNFLKILTYLKKHEGDGKYYDLEKILTVDKTTLTTILIQLRDEGLIKLKGGHRNSDMTVSFGDGKGNIWSPNKPTKIIYYPFEGQITFKGSNHLKDELNMKSNINLKTGKNSKVNLIVNSPKSKIIDDSKKIVRKTKQIIDKINTDNSISVEKKKNAIKVFEQLITESEKGKISEPTWSKVIETGSNIASIGSLILSLMTLK